MAFLLRTSQLIDALAATCFGQGIDGLSGRPSSCVSPAPGPALPRPGGGGQAARYRTRYSPCFTRRVSIGDGQVTGFGWKALRGPSHALLEPFVRVLPNHSDVRAG